MKAVRWTAVLALCLLLTGCAGEPPEKPEGEYTFAELSYLWPLSSSTPEWAEQQMEGTVYTIDSDVFCWKKGDTGGRIEQPQYVKEEVSPEAGKLLGGQALEQYSVYKEGEPQDIRLYVSQDTVWVASYIVTPTQEEMISKICRLERAA